MRNEKKVHSVEKKCNQEKVSDEMMSGEERANGKKEQNDGKIMFGKENVAGAGLPWLHLTASDYIYQKVLLQTKCDHECRHFSYQKDSIPQA